MYFVSLMDLFEVLSLSFSFFFFFFNDTATTEIYTLSYTTLFRSCRGAAAPPPDDHARPAPRVRARCRRSEEHTSELQSRLHLVCRLLLEKKKKKQDNLNYKNCYILHIDFNTCTT